MSIAKVKTVTRAQKDQGKCEKCGTELPKGSAYRWFKVGFRSRHKRVRCLDNMCTPRLSELESSRMADAYAAQEDAEASIETAICKEDLEAAIETCRDAADEVASEYEGTISETPMLEDQLRDKVQALEDWSSNLSDCTFDEQETDCETCEGTGSVKSEESEEADDCTECTDGHVFDFEAAREAALETVGSLEA